MEERRLKLPDLASEIGTTRRKCVPLVQRTTYSSSIGALGSIDYLSIVL